ncbi:MAG: hypothetical protein R2697_08695 [Ilumatobacteraceae bacterium]
MFGRAAPLIVDIGIGFGDTLTTMAAAELTTISSAATSTHRVSRPTLARIESMGLANVRLPHGDALVFSIGSPRRRWRAIRGTSSTRG